MTSVTIAGSTTSIAAMRARSPAAISWFQAIILLHGTLCAIHQTAGYGTSFSI